jgi:hypothetical protein
VAHSKGIRYGKRREAGDILEKNGGQDGSLCAESCSTGKQSENMADTENPRDVRRDGFLGIVEEEHNNRRSKSHGSGEWWTVEPDVGRVADGVAARVDRLKAIGNGQVPAVAATAWRLLK